MTTIYCVFAIFAGLIFIRHFLNVNHKIIAAQVALVGKYTYEQLSPNDKEIVNLQVVDYLRRGGIRSDPLDRFKNLESPELYIFYGLAMAELGISPAVPDFNWSYVRNPFVALINAKTHIKTAKDILHEKFNLELSL